MRNFERLATALDVKPLLEAIRRKSELFYKGSRHKDTESIFLRWCMGLEPEAKSTEIPAFNFPAMGELPEAHELINYTLHRVGALELGRTLIIKLHQGGKILPHFGEGAYADHYERFLITIDADRGCLFSCEDETVEMTPGDLFCFNHKLEHSVHNQSGKDCIYLIVDCVAPNFRREGLKNAV